MGAPKCTQMSATADGGRREDEKVCGGIVTRQGSAACRDGVRPLPLADKLAKDADYWTGLSALSFAFSAVASAADEMLAPHETMTTRLPARV
ncbi:hypothetical protein StoSoilB5_19160 [Arthrobacter sp. StoSoilB5]|nr:hypothetical protein StoSoilB5_19160 [Arthrobacter sp. StoSoilB5]